MMLSAFTIGILGSVHCVGMCGPLALAMPLGEKRGIAPILLYNLGRILTYVLLGALMGLLSKGVFLMGLQSWMTILLGVLLLVMGLFSIQLEYKIWNIPFLAEWYMKFKSLFSKLLSKTGYKVIFGLGLLNGLLPCGLVYVALAGALTLGNVSQGMTYMFSFGLGTFPLLLAFTLIGKRLGLPWQQKIRRVYPLAIALMGCFLLWRGIQFHVPASFSLWEALNNSPMCH